MTQLLTVLKPYFWPSKGTDGAVLNRLRALSTYIMITMSKVCSVYAPFMLVTATNALTKGHYYEAAEYIVWFCTLRFLTSFFKEMQSIMYLKVKQQATIELAELTFTHVHTLSLNWHLTKKTGNTVRVMDRGFVAANQLVTYLFLNLFPALAECFAVILLFLIEFNNPALAFLLFGGVACYAVSTICVTKYRDKLKKKANRRDNDYHEIATDSLINYETIKIFTAENFEISRYTNSVAKYEGYNVMIMCSMYGLNSIQQFIMQGTITGSLIIAGKAVVDGDLTIGDWVAILNWIMTVFVPLNFLGMIYQMVINASTDIRHLSELLSEEPEIKDAPDAKILNLPFSSSLSLENNTPTPSPTTPDSENDDSKSNINTTITANELEMGLIKPPAPPIYSKHVSQEGVSVVFEDVVFNYAGQDEAKGLHKVNFTVAPGTTTAIVGHTGSGKSTTFRLLLRFYDPKSGCIKIAGEDIKSLTMKSLRQHIGVVPQDIVLFNDSIMHNIMYGNLNATIEQVKDAARAASILDFIEQLPNGWDTVVGERGLKLSGGEKQRVGIARCLLKNPPVVLLDEATSALDTLTESSIQEALHTLGQHRTVVVIAHRLSTIVHADQIVVLNEGKLIERGSHEQLLAKGGAYSKLWAMQSKSSTSNLVDMEKGESEEVTA